MKIPEDVNTRAEDMWRIISQRVDFRDKQVIDLGCGHGEMLWRVHKAGASFVLGMDNDEDLTEEIHSAIVNQFPNIVPSLRSAGYPISTACDDIEKCSGNLRAVFGTNAFDIALCFSVLPYLDDIPTTLKWMSNNFPLCIIEAQYEPEPYNISVPSDDKMYVLLRENGFKCATWLGQTYVEDRDTHRSIWACSKKMLRL